MKKYLPYGLAIITLLIGFYGGLKYQQSKVVTVGRNFGGQNFQNLTAEQRQQMRSNLGNRGGAGGGAVSGEILSQDDKSITIKLPDGGSKIVFFSDSTTINQMVSGTKTDLVIGKTVVVMGTAGNDGTITAQNIQIRDKINNSNPVK